MASASVAHSVEPMLSFPRFDLSESSYALLLMGRRTPAWREVYRRILDEEVGDTRPDEILVGHRAAGVQLREDTFGGYVRKDFPFGRHRAAGGAVREGAVRDTHCAGGTVALSGW